MSCPAYQRIRTTLERWPDAKLGFIIYRCTYKSDAEWKQFIAYLTKAVGAQLEEEELEDIAGRLDWNVQEDSKSLNDADAKTVRRLVQFSRKLSWRECQFG